MYLAGIAIRQCYIEEKQRNQSDIEHILYRASETPTFSINAAEGMDEDESEEEEEEE
jgi:hypothetical protein